MQTQPMIVKYTIGFHIGYLQTIGSAGPAPKSCSPLYLPIYQSIVGRTYQKLGPQQDPELLINAVNLRSLFEISSAGTPKNLTTLSKNIFATEEA